MEGSMYQWSRTARLVIGHPRDSLDWAVRITEKVNQISSARASLWTSFASPDAGVCAWSMTVEDPAEIDTIDSKLAVDNGFLSLAAESANYVADGSVQDRLATVVYASPGATSGDFHWVQVTTTTVTPGNVRRGIELGVKIAQKANQITGMDVIFESGLTGAYGSVTWIGLADSFGQLQQGEMKLNTDTSFLELIDTEGSKAYQPVGTTVSCYRRVV
jgi:hypothetical protein